MTDKQTPSEGLTQADMSAITHDVIAKIPKDFHSITITNLLPLLTVIMAHVQQVKDLKGNDKKQLVLYCLDLMISNMPFPEKQVVQPIADAIAPAAIEGIIQGSRFAAKHVEQLVVSERKRRQDPGPRQLLSRITWPRRIKSPSSNKPTPPRAVLRTQLSMVRPMSLVYRSC